MVTPLMPDVYDDQQTPSVRATAVTSSSLTRCPRSSTAWRAGWPAVQGPVRREDPPHRLRIERHEIELAKTGSLGLANGLVVTFAGPAKIAQLAGAKWAAKIVTDVPAAPGPAKAVSPAL